uniref:Trehalase n=1 Tax=Panagrolaimus sp. PS1159 TaxID=55785 RepID=A0AC35FUA1_9BILA
MCDSSNSKNWQIYCGGRILEAYNYFQITNDSKEYVDMPLILSPNDTIANFEKAFGDTPPEKMSEEKFKDFLNQHFLSPGHELLNCTPDGWQDNPEKLMSIVDPELREWALQLNAIWKKLCKEMDQKVSLNPEKYSLLPLEHKFIAPGGRFREPYYWDAYWIIKGLIASELYEAAMQMVYNFANFIEKYGFVPNGGRVYYLQRSQPPMFIPSVYEIYDATQNASFVEEMMPFMVKEFEYWHNSGHQYNITINNNNYTVYRYRAQSNTPRPESYKEDVATAATANFTDKVSKQRIWRDLATAAETGQDFSTRWFADKKTLETIETINVLPVDLNSFLCWNMDILSYLYDEVIRDDDESEKYRNILAKHRRAVHAVFYNESEQMWLDYNIRTGAHNPTFYATLSTPLFTNCYNSLDQSKAEGVFKFFNRSHAFDYPGGVPHSMVRDVDQQWDFPNGWGHINHMIIEGLRKSEAPAAQDAAFSLATKWVRGNYRVYKATKHMWEKYDVVGTIPVPGKGGEYEVQDGFGWTNGAILDLLVTYADRITAGNAGDGSTTPATSIQTTSQSITNATTQNTSQSVANTVTSSKSTPSTTTTNDGKTLSLNYCE